MDVVNLDTSMASSHASAVVSLLEPPLPSQIQLEPTTVCNLDCIMCPINSLQRDKNMMTLDEFKDLVGRFPKLERITMHGIGEPLMNRDFFNMVEYAKSRGIRVYFNNNMTYMTEANARKLLSLGVDEIRTSLDTPYKDEYARIRPARNQRTNFFDEVVENVRTLVRVRNELGSKTRIKLVGVCMDETIRQMPDLTRLGVELGVDEIMIQNMQLWSGKDEFREDREGKVVADQVMAEVYEECRDIAAGKVPLKMWHPGVSHGCNWAETSCYVTVDGYVTPCCNCPDPKVKNFGNLNEKSLEEIWYSDDYKEFRRALASPDIPAICDGCVIYGGRFKEY